MGYTDVAHTKGEFIVTAQQMIKVTDTETGEIVEMTELQFIAKRDELLIAWDNAKTALDEAKETEMKFRKAVVNFAFDPNKKKGTETIELGNGYKAKSVKKINYGFIKDANDKVNKTAIEQALQKIEATGPVGELIAERLIKWTPDLSLTEYNQLDPKFKTIIDKVIVTTEGAPTLEIIAPKAK